MFYYQVAATTRTGRRAVNQDNICIGRMSLPAQHGDGCFIRRGRLFSPLFAAVADGMGGESDGEVASALTCHAVRQNIPRPFATRGGLARAASRMAEHANRSVCRHSAAQGRKAGTTLVVCALHRSGFLIGSVGDSRAYLLRDGRLTLLTHDHTEAQCLMDAGILTREEARVHPSRNRLLRYIGDAYGRRESPLALSAPIRLMSGDVILLCTDGVWGSLRQSDTERIARQTDAAYLSDELVARSLENGSTDNLTALAIRVWN